MATNVESENTGFQFDARTLALILVVIGLLISGYLSYVKLADVEIICTEGETVNCQVVENSKWASIMGIPVAYLGFAGYALMGLILLLEDRIDFLMDYGRTLNFTIGIFGWLFSMWLVYVQAGILQAYCLWCLTHEVNFTILFGVVCYLLWQEMRE